MTDAEFIAIAIARKYGLDPVMLIRASAFLGAVHDALQLMSPEELIAAVVAPGGLQGLDNVYGGVIARIRKLPENKALRDRISRDETEKEHWLQLGRAARRGQTLGGSSPPVSSSPMRQSGCWRASSVTRRCVPSPLRVCEGSFCDWLASERHGNGGSAHRRRPVGPGRARRGALDRPRRRGVSRPGEPPRFRCHLRARGTR